jgi:nucleoside-diphosphate-sugar epimerase
MPDPLSRGRERAGERGRVGRENPSIISPPTNDARSIRMQLLLTGATGQIGDFLLPRLASAGHPVRAVSRGLRPTGADVTWFQADLLDPLALESAARGCEAAIHMAPLWTLPPHLPVLAGAGVRRVLAFGSTSRYGKRDSSDPGERDVVNRLVQAETVLSKECAALGMDWTLFRPTLIYGGGRDRNVTAIRQFVERFGVFVIAGNGHGLRQPVHADDLARACVDALAVDATRDKAYNLCGAETLTYRAMVERIFRAAGRTPRILSLPLPFLRLLLRSASLLPGYAQVSVEMADRMNRDLVYDHKQAATDFGYSPRGFQP